MATAITASSASDDMEGFLSQISSASYQFLQPTADLQAAAIAAAKCLLDPLAFDVSAAQTRRRDENRRKRKRGAEDDEETVLQLRQVYTNGLGAKQVWEQSRRILDAACNEAERAVDEKSTITKPAGKKAHVPKELVSDSQTDGTDEDEDMLEVEADIEDDIGEDELEEDEEDEKEDLGDGEDIEADEDEFMSDEDEGPAQTYEQDPNNLNDGFFSIDDFNKQSTFLEQQDARGDDDDPSDEDDVDWTADPLTMSYHKPKPGRSAGEEAEEEDDGNDDDDEEGGPTFGDADLDASEDDEALDDDGDDMDDAMPGLINTNDIRYTDFYEPPPKKPSKTKRMRALPKTQPPPRPSTNQDTDVDNDVERAMADVRRDLLDSEDEGSDVASDADTPGRDKNFSTHEKQRAAIAAEIRRLEAANIAKKDWTLIGEARAADRPFNSLIEEDLEFERIGKPVPVITAEVTEDIEALIKRRILAREFDEVVRRRPDAVGAAGETRRGRIELDDSKSKEGLGALYEAEHLRSTDPGYVDQRSEKTKRQHEEIGTVWKETEAQLNSLSNLHFKPKRVEAEIKTVEDKPTISMEDARPAGVEGQSMLAPQEVYRLGETRRDGEIVTGVGGVAKEELTREEKTRRRRREKERGKKGKAQGEQQAAAAAGKDGKAGKKTKGEEKKDIIEELRRGGVKVVGKKGEVTDIAGKKEDLGRTRGGEVRAGNLKL